MPKLRPRARIIRTIGDRLISGPEAALIELVKNSFDADSAVANITILPRGPETPGGTILVSDEGHGMSKSEIIGRWFEPATDDKLQRRTSPGGRPMLGEKGIGRFAAARLGRFTRLESTHCSGDSRSLVTVDIDWNWFTAEKYLDEIDIPVEETKLTPKSKALPGVDIYISDLRDQWTEKALESLIRELRRLASPVKTREENFSIRLDITAFTLESHGFDGQELLSRSNLTSGTTDDTGEEDPLLIRPFGLQEQADYSLSGDFDSNGNFTGTFVTQRGDARSQPLAVAALPLKPEEDNCGAFHLRINIYDRETDAIRGLFARMGLNLDRIGLLNARRILTENAGISIFRKDFRIRPYGEPENDWLELERQRVNDPSKKLGISQVSGLVQVGDEESSGLIERSSREGLEHNGSFERLKSLIQNVLLHAEERRFDFRKKAGISRALPGNLENLRQAASLRRVAQVAKTLPHPHREKVEEAINQDSAELAEELKQIDQYQQILQSRAALGLVLAEVVHEGRRFLNPVATSAKAILDGRDWLMEHSERGVVYRRQFPENAQVVQDGVRDLGKLFKKLDPISGRKRGRPAKFSVCQVIQRSLGLFEETISNAAILLGVECESTLVAYGYEEDIQAALMNIIDNATFWLATGDQPRKMRIDVTATKKYIRIVLSNNGPLISPSYVERLFEAGFTLKSSGTGLGLAISREAMRRSKGDVTFDQDSPETTFVIQIPRPED
ncbi:MAG: sensor histidine kinase [Terracidiphilus sp.]